VNRYSGRTADERPVRFRLEDCQYMVEEVLDQWYGPQDAFYKVRADDCNLYILRRETSTPDGSWHLIQKYQLLRVDLAYAFPPRLPALLRFRRFLFLGVE
jgi:hypothetical protein